MCVGVCMRVCLKLCVKGSVGEGLRCYEKECAYALCAFVRTCVHARFFAKDCPNPLTPLNSNF